MRLVWPVETETRGWWKNKDPHALRPASQTYAHIAQLQRLYSARIRAEDDLTRD